MNASLCVWQDLNYICMWAKDNFHFARILHVGYHWLKNVLSRRISFAAIGVCHGPLVAEQERENCSFSSVLFD